MNEQANLAIQLKREPAQGAGDLRADYLSSGNAFSGEPVEELELVFL